MLPIVINFLLAIHVIVSLLIVLLVLMQRPKNEGLGAAFGGGMTENLFGAQTTNVLQTATRYLGALFFALTLALSWLYVKKSTSASSLQQKLSAPTVIPATPAPATPAPEDKLQMPVATPVPLGEKAPEAASDAVKAAPAPAPEAVPPAPEVPAPAAPEAAKPAAPAEKPAGQ